jgi:hypothetical protein
MLSALEGPGIRQVRSTALEGGGGDIDADRLFGTAQTGHHREQTRVCKEVRHRLSSGHFAESPSIRSLIKKNAGR